MSLDLINGLFELGGAILLWLNVMRLRRDKCVRGVHPAPTAFFACWAIWNLWFYPSLGQWWSFYAGIGVGIVNFIWLTQMLYYAHHEKRK